MHSHAGHSHAHGHHGHAHPPLSAGKLRISLVLTAVYIAVLLVAGVKAHSLALLSEAGHNGSDFLALVLSWGAAYWGERPPTSTKTYGWRRAGVLAAFVNSITLIVLSGCLLYSAVERLGHPQPVEAGLMMWVAAAGVVLNGAIALMLVRGAHDLNVRSVLVHQVGDTLSTAAVIAGGWAIAFTGRSWIDPALSIAIALMILWSSASIIRESLNILLEGLPSGMELERIHRDLRAVRGVLDVHDLHVWSIGSDTHALSAHITIADIPPSESNVILDELRVCLRQRHQIHHTTIQFESADCDLAHGCIIPVPHSGHDHSGDHPHDHE